MTDEPTSRAMAQVREMMAAQHELEAAIKLFEAALTRGDIARTALARKNCHNLLDKVLTGKEIQFEYILQMHMPGTKQ